MSTTVDPSSFGDELETTDLAEEAGRRGARTLTGRLLSTQPNPPIDGLMVENDVARWEAHLLRGIYKIGGVDGMPAVGDLLIALWLGLRAGGEGSLLSRGGEGDEEATTEPAPEGPDGDVVL